MEAEEEVEQFTSGPTPSTCQWKPVGTCLEAATGKSGLCAAHFRKRGELRAKAREKGAERKAQVSAQVATPVAAPAPTVSAMRRTMAEMLLNGSIPDSVVFSAVASMCAPANVAAPAPMAPAPVAPFPSGQHMHVVESTTTTVEKVEKRCAYMVDFGDGRATRCGKPTLVPSTFKGKPFCLECQKFAKSLANSGETR